MIHALIFDYNGVLVNDVVWHIKAYQQVFQKAGIEISDQELIGHFGSPTEYMIKTILAEHKSNADWKTVKEQKDRKANELIEKNKVFSLETIETLKELKKTYRLAIYSAATTKEMNIPPKKFFALFEEIINAKSIMLGIKPKPAPDGLLHIAKKLKLDPKECAYIGDMPPDMTTAKAADCKAIGITTGIFTAEQLKEAGADIIIKELKELMKIEL